MRMIIHSQQGKTCNMDIAGELSRMGGTGYLAILIWM